MSCPCACHSTANRVRVIVFADLVIALIYTIYRVTKLSLDLKRVFGLEYGQQIVKKQGNLSFEEITLKKFSAVFLITAAVVGLAIEIFLFFLLSNGVRSKNYRHCKHWFIIRVLLLTLSFSGSLIEHIREEYSLLNGILEIDKIYRILTLVVVRNFMQEIYKGMTDNNFDAMNSSIGEIGPGTNLRSHSQSHVTF